MALITCLDCGKRVSSRAESCPNCGAPIGGEENNDKPVKVLVERTGKNLKGQMVICWMAFVLGIITVFSAKETGDRQIGVWIILGTIVWYVVIKLSVWWHHE